MEDVIVLGGGAAGLSAALMLGRARRRTLVIDAGAPRNRFAAHMHGVLGSDGVPPNELLARGRAEVEGYGVRFASEEAARVDEDEVGVTVTLGDGTLHRARALILATGLADDLPAIPGLAERWGRSVLHCPYCHGWEVRDQTIGVLPTSPMALHLAELVRQWSDRIVVFTGLLESLDPEIERRMRARGIRIVPDDVLEIVGDGDAVAAVRTSSADVAVDAVFTGGTPRPLDSAVAGLGLERTDTPFGSFLAVDLTGRTSSPRIWAAGNVVNPGANVPIAMSLGTTAGAAVNAALVGEDAAAALREADALAR